MTARKDFGIVRDKFARDNGLPFGRLLTRDYVLGVLEDGGHDYRPRVFCPLVTLWAWLSQCLSQDKSLNEAVSRVLAHRVSIGLPACSASSAAYAKARTRFPETAMRCMAREVGRKVHGQADGSWNWNGREVFLVDGTTFSMPDTIENQLEYPKSNPDNAIGFPIMRAVALVSLATGAVLDMEFAKYAGKGTGEIALFRKVSQKLRPDSIVVADRYYPSFATMALLKQRGIDLVSISHQSRIVDFSAGHVLGPKDHIVAWQKPRACDSGVSNDVYADLPDGVLVREFVIDIDARDGGKEQAVVVTTLTDPAIPQKEISDLYWARWHCELDIRAIKHSFNLEEIRAKSPSMVRKEIWAHLLAYNLLRGTMVESAKRNDVLPRHLSVKGTMQAIESFTPAMMAIDGSDTLYNAMLATVSAHRVGNRPGRQEPRRKKSRPVWGHYMTVPRNKSHRKLAREARLCVPLS